MVCSVHNLWQSHKCFPWWKPLLCCVLHKCFMSTFHLATWNIRKIWMQHWDLIKFIFVTASWRTFSDDSGCLHPCGYLVVKDGKNILQFGGAVRKFIAPFTWIAFELPLQMWTQWERGLLLLLWGQFWPHGTRTNYLQKQRGLHENNIMYLK